MPRRRRRRPELVPLDPGIFRARYDTGPDVLLYGALAEEAAGAARELAHGPTGRGALLALERWRPGGWVPCWLQPALPFQH